MNQCPGKWVEIGHAVVCFARAAHAFSAGIKCPHCMCVACVLFVIHQLKPRKGHTLWCAIGAGTSRGTLSWGGTMLAL